ncbi:MAG TPA: PIN domain-containing protein [Thermoplasmata archaeon]|nr:PIN domain-containing protein [Thermoplasmata archaeon]
MATRPIDLVLDSFAWIEYFRGGVHSATVEKALRASRCATPVHVLAELADKYSREGLSGLTDALDFVEIHTTVLPLTRPVAERAGKTKADRRAVVSDFPLADAIVYEAAQEAGANLLTGDPHFHGMPDVRFLA